jgi:hypothetical protein
LTENVLGLVTTSEQAAQGRTQTAFYTFAPGGEPTRISPFFNSGSTARANAAWGGTAEDLSVLLVRSQEQNQRFLPADTTALGQESLYELVGADTANPELRLVGVEPGGAPIGAPACGRSTEELSPAGKRSGVGTEFHAIAQDATTTSIFFVAYPNATGTTCSTDQQQNPAEVFARRESRAAPYSFREVEVSASQCAREATDPAGPCYTGTAANGYVHFEGASADGNRVYFSTVRQLVDGDIDTGTTARDLYLYEFSRPPGERLVPVTVTGTTTPTDLRGVVRISDDGSRVYFVAGDVLATNPGVGISGGVLQTATLGADNLYLYERDAAHPDGHVVFIAQLGAADSADWQARDRRPAATIGDIDSPDNGHFLLFTTASRLLPSDTDSLNDIYAYDSEPSAGNPDGSLERIWTADPAHNGASRITGTAVIESIYNSGAQASWRQTPSRMAPDGLPYVFFTTAESLSPEDTNEAEDVYQWRDGTVSLVSDGVAPLGSNFNGTTPSGRDVFVSTEEPIVAQDTDTAYDAYDARIGGGFRRPVAAVSCASEQCQGGSSSSPGWSAPLSGSPHEEAPVTPATFSVGRISSVAARKLARTGRLKLVVKVSAPGKLAVRGTAPVAGKVRTVAQSRRRTAKAGSVHIPLILSKAARRWLTMHGTLTLKLSTTFSASTVDRVTRVKLHARRSHVARRHGPAAAHNGGQS